MNAMVARQRGAPLKSSRGGCVRTPDSCDSDWETDGVGASFVMGQCNSAKGCRAKWRSKSSRTCAAVSKILAWHPSVLARGSMFSTSFCASAASTGTSAGSSEGLGSDSNVFTPVRASTPNIDGDDAADTQAPTAANSSRSEAQCVGNRGSMLGSAG